MKKFDFTVKEPLGIHARPAGMLTKEAKKYSSTITLKKDGIIYGTTNLIASDDVERSTVLYYLYLIQKFFENIWVRIICLILIIFLIIYIILMISQNKRRRRKKLKTRIRF